MLLRIRGEPAGANDPRPGMRKSRGASTSRLVTPVLKLIGGAETVLVSWKLTALPLTTAVGGGALCPPRAAGKSSSVPGAGVRGVVPWKLV